MSTHIIRRFHGIARCSRGSEQIARLNPCFYSVNIAVNSTCKGNINVEPAGKTVLALRLAPYGTAGDDGGLERSFPGSETPPAGITQVVERLTGTKFWKSPKGVAILSGVGGGALLAGAAAMADPGKDQIAVRMIRHPPSNCPPRPAVAAGLLRWEFFSMRPWIPPPIHFMI